MTNYRLLLSTTRSKLATLQSEVTSHRYAVRESSRDQLAELQDSLYYHIIPDAKTSGLTTTEIYDILYN